MRCLTVHEVHFGTDQAVWDRLMEYRDPVIAKKTHMVLHANRLYSLVDQKEADIIVKSKFRGVDPWIDWEGRQIRLTSLENDLAEEFKAVSEKIEKGWAIKFKEAALAVP